MSIQAGYCRRFSHNRLAGRISFPPRLPHGQLLPLFFHPLCEYCLSAALLLSLLLLLLLAARGGGDKPSRRRNLSTLFSLPACSEVKGKTFFFFF